MDYEIKALHFIDEDGYTLCHVQSKEDMGERVSRLNLLLPDGWEVCLYYDKSKGRFSEIMVEDRLYTVTYNKYKRMLDCKFKEIVSG